MKKEGLNRAASLNPQNRFDVLEDELSGVEDCHEWPEDDEKPVASETPKTIKTTIVEA